MLTAIIIDDEKNARTVIAHSIKNYYSEKVKLVAECSNVSDGVKAIRNHNPDVVFLDIEMPKESGFQLFNYFKEIDFDVVFVTAYSKYALKAFEVSAVDYLLKPLQLEQFENTVNKLFERKKQVTLSMKANILKENLASEVLQKITIPYVGGYHFIDIKDIIAIEAERAYSKIILKTGKPITASKSLNKFEDILCDNQLFFKSSRSHLINLKYITNYHKNTSIIELSGNYSAKLSRNNKIHFETIISKK